MLRLLFLASVLVAPMSFAATAAALPASAVSAQGVLLESVGIQTLGGVFTPLVARGCHMPCTMSFVFSTAEDNQSEIKLFVFVGNAKLAKDATRLGTYVIGKVPKMKRGLPEVEVTFSVKSSSVEIQAIDKQSKTMLPVKRDEP